ncbi:arginine--tRNA ligase [Cytophagaceae bacterium DM2B3-1]|uniref:Arginine--tRNA ligase n=1 Tax=Xanthocytophaga flava TaxID=3048013 RepID=A0ABT7CK17_9BACT|nr:arginine--tRNA ligase [Xanthocytophaga flavus]MDJ1494084.1 arginine--tRNA ligase [Xanthocytophaga flavus]
MTLEQTLQTQISQALSELFSIQVPSEEVLLQATRKDFEGSHTFVTFQIAKQVRKSPVEVGQQLGDYLQQKGTAVSRFNVVQGFLNLVLSDAVWIELFKSIQANTSYGFQPANGQKVMVEYSSPNTNKPLHLGHLRNNFLGYSIAQILKANGYEVMKTNIVNDRGIHICKSMLAYQKFGNGETPESSNTKGDKLVGQYYVEFDKRYKAEIAELKATGISEEEAEKQAPLMKEAQQMLVKWEQGDSETVALWKKMNGWVYAGFDVTYKRMGVDFDKFYYESNTYLLGKGIVNEGLEKGIFFKKENGSVWIDLTDLGLDEKLLLRGDGTSVYITQDLGLADLKHTDFPMDKSVYVVGNEQDYHFKVLFSILKKLGRPYSDGLYHLSYGMVDLPSGKMKSREGTVVDADDLMNEMVETAEERSKALSKVAEFPEEERTQLFNMLGLGALKYFLLKVDPVKRMLFNPEESIDLHGHTATFIQYTHARISTILRKSQEFILVDIPGLYTLHEAEKDLVILLSEFPNVIKDAGNKYAPSTIANYCYEMAKSYNRFFDLCSIFKADTPEQMSFRVALSAEVGKVIKKGMNLLGIQVPDRM